MLGNTKCVAVAALAAPWVKSILGTQWNLEHVNNNDDVRFLETLYQFWISSIFECVL